MPIPTFPQALKILFVLSQSVPLKNMVSQVVCPLKKSQELTGFTQFGTHDEENHPTTCPYKSQSFPAFAKILSK